MRVKGTSSATRNSDIESHVSNFCAMCHPLMIVEYQWKKKMKDSMMLLLFFFFSFFYLFVRASLGAVVKLCLGNWLVMGSNL